MLYIINVTSRGLKMTDKGLSTRTVEIDVDSLWEAAERNSGGRGAVVQAAAGAAFSRKEHHAPVQRPSWGGTLVHRSGDGRKIDGSPFRCGR